MALSNLAGWNTQTEEAAASACGSSDNRTAACGSSDNRTSGCGSACGSSDK